MTQYSPIRFLIDCNWRERFGTPTDLDNALATPEKGFAIWRRTSPAKHAEIIFRATALVRERIETIASAMTLE